MLIRGSTRTNLKPQSLLTGTLGAAVLGKELYAKARAKNQPFETKPRILETVKILGIMQDLSFTPLPSSNPYRILKSDRQENVLLATQYLKTADYTYPDDALQGELTDEGYWASIRLGCHHKNGQERTQVMTEPSRTIFKPGTVGSVKAEDDGGKIANFPELVAQMPAVLIKDVESGHFKPVLRKVGHGFIPHKEEQWRFVFLRSECRKSTFACQG